MYLEYFGFEEEPFSTAPDPRFLYKSPMHQEALERIVTAVRMRKGINAIIGEPGLGKSTLIRTMLAGFSSNVHYAWVFNTTMDGRELVKYICRDFGFMPSSTDLADVLMELYEFLIYDYEQGKYAILIIDEAQNLEAEVLEQVRQLSNLETSSKKLLQIILSGQPQLEYHLEDPKLVQLKQRISLKATLGRMNQIDTQAYINHRIIVAGSSRDDIFSSAAIEAIYEISDGIPRMINQICDNALMVAAAAGQNQINSQLVRDLLQEGKITQASPAPEIPRSYLNVSEYKNTAEQSGKVDKQYIELFDEEDETFEVLDLAKLAI